MPDIIAPSDWVVAHAALLPKPGRVLDLACGRGRHSRFLASVGCSVLAVDQDAEALSGLSGLPGIETRCCDLEGAVWPLAGAHFDGIVVTNYLWRPRVRDLLSLLRPGGILIYETFMQGHERYGRPSRSDFLLAPGELKEIAEKSGLTVENYIEGYVALPKPAMRQAICARRPEFISAAD